MDHYSAGFAPSGAFARLGKFFSQPFLDSTGQLSLARIALASTAPRAILHIFANYRQIRHMSSPAYRAPEHWGAPETHSAKKRKSSYIDAFDRVRHRLRMELLDWGASLLVNAGMLFGGYDKLWRLCEGVAISATPGTDSLAGRVVTTTLFAMGTVAVDFIPGLVWGPIYRYFTSTSTPSMPGLIKDGLVFTFSNFWYMSDKEKRDAVWRSPAWKQWSMAGCTLGLVLFLPVTALTTIYERLGSKSSAALAKTIGVGIAAFLALGNGPFLWASWRGKLDPEMEFDRKTGTKWPTLAQWSLGRELNLDPEELESKIRTMLPELSCVEILVQTASDEDNGNGSESLAASLLIPAVRMSKSHCLIRLTDTQFGSLGLQEQLAVIAEAIVKTGTDLRWHYLHQLGIVLKVLPYPFLHDYYMRQPSALGGIFPTWTTKHSSHIPLAISWTATSCLIGILDCVNDIAQATELKVLLREDRRIAAFSPECAAGLPKVLRRRDQVRGEQEGPLALRYDIGSMDKVYAAVKSGSPQDSAYRIANLRDTYNESS